MKLKSYKVENPRFNPFSMEKDEWHKTLEAFGTTKHKAYEAIKAFYPEIRFKDLKLTGKELIK